MSEVIITYGGDERRPIIVTSDAVPGLDELIAALLSEPSASTWLIDEWLGTEQEAEEEIA